MAVALVIAAFFVANINISSEMASISALFIIILAIPSFIAMIIWLGWKKGLTSIIILSIYAVVIETFAILTGFPYSPFHYTELIGTKLFGYTPFTLPFGYVPLFMGCIYLANLYWQESLPEWKNMLKLVIITALLVLTADLILDPAAVSLNFWVYEYHGIFYGVPLQNFLGWILTGIIAALIGLLLFKKELITLKLPAILSSLFLIISFWTAVCLYRQLWLPGIIGVLFIFFILNKTKGKVGDFRVNPINKH
ncbi:MAG: carotene biosynthesis associated membrane protein [Methanobacterium sp. Maddingley MBC34]|nr:MAG: carotene biosynthesis associated membrane protein [Methanobacterium sp. Maddingley MBC34]